MNDVLPEEVGRWQKLERIFRSLVELYGFREVRTPIVEDTGLFVRSIGEATDVVDKEMYSFERHRDSLTLRPEGTAGAVRAYVEHGVSKREPVTRWYYLGSMFRAERPQRGRYRQFHQAGCEVFGEAGPISDVETISMVYSLMTNLGIEGVEIAVNSIGGPGTRARYRDALLAHFTPKLASLSEHAQQRLQINPLRVLDSKDPRDIEASQGAPSILEHLEDADREHWEAVVAGLQALGTPYCIEPTLVRGLDYYTRTLFEVRASSGQLGSQNALAGGGRYDGLVASLGGPETPAFGFALGIERVLLAMPEEPQRVAPLCYVAPMGVEAQRLALVAARELRGAGLGVEVDGRGGSLKSMLRRADSLGSRFVLVIGESEVARSVVALKDLVAHDQQEVALAELVARVQALASRPVETTGGPA